MVPGGGGAAWAGLVHGGLKGGVRGGGGLAGSATDTRRPGMVSMGGGSGGLFSAFSGCGTLSFW